MTQATNPRPSRRLLIAQLLPHPMNRDPGDVDDVVEGFRATGQLVPILVRPASEAAIEAAPKRVAERAPNRSQPMFEVLDGGRRVEAAWRLGWKDLEAVEHDLNDAEALVVLISANQARRDPDPFQEARLIDELVHVHGGSVRAAASKLGRTLRWVAARLSLRTLSATWTAARASAPFASWPIEAWELVCRLAPEAQDALRATPGCDDLFGENAAPLDEPGLIRLRDLVERQTRVLGSAPFRPEDADLVAEAGPCTTCPKSSLQAEGLFDTGEPREIGAAICRDGLCWARKVGAHVKAQLRDMAAGRAESDPLPVVAKMGAPKVKGAGRIVGCNGWRDAKKSDVGAVQAAIVHESGRVSTGWVKVHEAAPDARPKAPGRKVETPAEALARLELEYDWTRARERYSRILLAVAKLKDPTPLQIGRLALLFGIEWRTWDVQPGKAAAEAKRRLKICSGYDPESSRLDVLWDGVRIAIENRSGLPDAVELDLFRAWSAGVIDAAELDPAAIEKIDAAVESSCPVPALLLEARKAAGGAVGASAAAEPAPAAPEPTKARKRARTGKGSAATPTARRRRVDSLLRKGAAKPAAKRARPARPRKGAK